jgi:hypothetical protein
VTQRNVRRAKQHKPQQRPQWRKKKRVRKKKANKRAPKRRRSPDEVERATTEARETRDEEAVKQDRAERARELGRQSCPMFGHTTNFEGKVCRCLNGNDKTPGIAEGSMPAHFDM